MVLLGSGKTSNVYDIGDGKVKKVFDKIDDASLHIGREKYWLKKLFHSGIVPKIFEVDENKKYIILENAGEPITALNAPNDWKSQLLEILEVLRENKCNHNDIDISEILVKNGQLKLIDFSYATKIDDETCEGRFPLLNKSRILLDEYIVNYIEYIISVKNSSIDSVCEPHCIVAWNVNHRDIIEESFPENLQIIRCYLFKPSFFGSLKQRRYAFFKKFYSNRPVIYGEKGLESFFVYVVIDLKPLYEKRTNKFSGEESIVNTSIFDFKNTIRNQKTGIMHGSDNIQESHDNFKALTPFNLNEPFNHWDNWRPKFKNLHDLFTKLNNTPGLKYVVMRDYKSLFENKIKGDIDILVNNRQLFNRVTGAVYYKHTRPQISKVFGLSVGCGGYKVAAHVLIGGKQVPVDVRCTTENYYCQGWCNDILTNSRLVNDVKIPDLINDFYATAYHELIHKPFVRNEVMKKLHDKGVDIGLIESLNEDFNEENLLNMLNSYMERQNYTFVEPDELSIKFNRNRGTTVTKQELDRVKRYLNSGYSFKSRDLIKRLSFRSGWNFYLLKYMVLSQIYLLRDTLGLPTMKNIYQEIMTRINKSSLND